MLLPAPAWTALAAVAACAALASRPGWRGAAGWTALLVAGQAGALALYRAGPVVTYHHLRPDFGDPLQLAAAGVLGLQAGVVALGLVLRRAELGALLRGLLRPWQALALLAVLALASAKIARPPQALALEVATVTMLHLVALANACLAAAALRASAGSDVERLAARLLGPPHDGPQPGRADRFALAVALWAVLVPALLNVLVYERHPHVPDEIVYLLHARYLAAGRLWLAAPPVPAAFDVDLMLLSGERWFCPVPIGWPAALAVGVFLGVPWLVNPVLSGLCVLLAYAFARELAGRRTARLLILLLALSPWFLFLGMSFMTHTWQLTCTLAAALGVARARRTGRHAWALAGGLALGMVALIRPLDGVVLAALLGVWSIGLGGRPLRAGATALLVLGAIAVGGLSLPYNALLTGKASKFPIMEYNDVTYAPGSNDMGFGPEKGAGMDWRGLDPWPGHTPFQAAVNHQFNLFGIDSETFGWASGSIWLMLLALAWRWRRREDRLMWTVVTVTVLGSSFYYFSGGPDFGARYWAMLLVPCIWLTVSGLEALQERVGPARGLLVPLLLTFSALSTFVPWRATDKYPGYRGMVAGVRELASAHGFGEARALVLVRGRRHPDYASAAVYNQLDWEADAAIYAWDRSLDVRAEVLRRYSDRPVWILEGPSVSGGSFRLVEGPLDAGELLERTLAEQGPRSGEELSR